MKTFRCVVHFTTVTLICSTSFFIGLLSNAENEVEQIEMASIHRTPTPTDPTEPDNLNNNCECLPRVEIKCKSVLKHPGLSEFAILYDSKGTMQNKHVYTFNKFYMYVECHCIFSNENPIILFP